MVSARFFIKYCDYYLNLNFFFFKGVYFNHTFFGISANYFFYFFSNRDVLLRIRFRNFENLNCYNTFTLIFYYEIYIYSYLYFYLNLKINLFLHIEN